MLSRKSIRSYRPRTSAANRSLAPDFPCRCARDACPRSRPTANSARPPRQLSFSPACRGIQNGEVASGRQWPGLVLPACRVGGPPAQRQPPTSRGRRHLGHLTRTKVHLFQLAPFASPGRPRLSVNTGRQPAQPPRGGGEDPLGPCGTAAFMLPGLPPARSFTADRCLRPVEKRSFPLHQIFAPGRRIIVTIPEPASSTARHQSGNAPNPRQAHG